MKLLLDFLPIILFFGAYKWGSGHADLAAQWMTHTLGFMVSGGIVGIKESPTMLATVVVAVFSIIQIVTLKVMRKKIDTMLWVSVIIVLGLGGLTVYFHDETFIKWKPTLIYWAMGGGLFFSDIIFKRYVLRTMMNAADIEVPDAVWRNLSWAWVLFFGGMGVLNLWVAYHYSTDTWVNFKMWGSLGLTLVFTLAQGVYLSRQMPPLPDKAKTEA
jgi:intracellular septation protein